MRGRRPFRKPEGRKACKKFPRSIIIREAARAASSLKITFAAEETWAAKFPLGDGKFPETLHSPLRHGNPRVQTLPRAAQRQNPNKKTLRKENPPEAFPDKIRSPVFTLSFPYAPFTARAAEKTTFCALPRQRARARPKMRRPPPVRAPCKPGCPPRQFRR